jgi:hypothetical protein
MTAFTRVTPPGNMAMPGVTSELATTPLATSLHDLDLEPAGTDADSRTWGEANGCHGSLTSPPGGMTSML